MLRHILNNINERVQALFANHYAPTRTKDYLAFTLGSINHVVWFEIEWRNKGPHCFQCVYYSIAIIDGTPKYDKHKQMILSPTDITQILTRCVNEDDEYVVCDLNTLSNILPKDKVITYTQNLLSKIPMTQIIKRIIVLHALINQDIWDLRDSSMLLEQIHTIATLMVSERLSQEEVDYPIPPYGLEVFK